MISYYLGILPSIGSYKAFTGEVNIILDFRCRIIFEILKILLFLTFDSLWKREDYDTNQFFSELGGAAGLVLGISLISIVRILDYSLSMTVNTLAAYINTCNSMNEYHANSKLTQT